MKVSIIIPVYNVEKYLDECMLSAVNQTLDDVEIIAIDDKSTDSSFEILNSYKEKYDFIKIFQNEKNRGLSISRNRGLKHAKGEYVYFLDSDDYIEPDTMEICYNKAKENDAHIVTFDAKTFHDKDYIGNKTYENHERNNIIKDKYIKGEDFFNKYYPVGAYRTSVCFNLYQREFLIKNKLYFYEGIMHEDELHSLQVFLRAERVIYIPRIFFNRRVRDNSIMTDCNYKKRIEGIEIVLKEIHQFYLEDKSIFSIETINNIKKHMQAIFNIAIDLCYRGNLVDDKNRIKETFKFNQINNNKSLKGCKKNIVFLMYVLLEGGAEKALMTILDNLDYSKYNVDLIVLAKEKSYLYDIDENVNVSYIYDSMYTLYQDYVDGKFNFRFEKEYDIEIAYLDIFTTWVIDRFGNSTAKKITWLHGVVPYAIGGNTPEYMNELYGRMDEIICVSNGVKQSVIDFAGNNLENKLKVIYNAMDTGNIKKLAYEKLDYEKKGFTILTIGRLIEEKGFNKLIRVHKRLIDEGIENKLVIVGNGKEKQNLINLIQSLKIEDSCEIIEYQNNVYKWIKMCDVFVSSSSTEGLGLVIMEAMILSKPIVATDTDGSRELLKNNLGLLVGNSEEGLYYGIRNMILNKGMREIYTKNLERLSIFDFDKEVIMPNIEALF